MRKTMIDWRDTVAVKGQAQLLDLNRSSARAVSDRDLALLRPLGELRLEVPF